MPEYQELLDALDREFTYTFGGCSINPRLDGTYLSQSGARVRDRINLIYTDTAVALTRNFELVARYVDELKRAVFEALDEEAVLIVVLGVFHAA